MIFQKYKICRIDLYLEIQFTVYCYHLYIIKTTSSCCLTGFSLSIMIKIFGNGVEPQLGIKSLFFSIITKIICKLDHLSHFISGISGKTSAKNHNSSHGQTVPLMWDSTSSKVQVVKIQYFIVIFCSRLILMYICTKIYIFSIFCKIFKIFTAKITCKFSLFLTSK